MQEIKKFAAKVKVTKQNKGNKILLTLSEAEGMELEISALQKRIKELEEKISNYVPEIIYVPAESEATETTSLPVSPAVEKKTQPKKVKVINVTGSPFRD